MFFANFRKLLIILVCVNSLVMGISSIYYLVLHREKSTFCETDLTKKKEREEFLKVIEWLTDLLFDKIEAKNETERIAINALKEGIDQEVVARISGLSLDRIKMLI